MPITALDIKYRQSQRLTDNPDGGGRMVQTEIVDGRVNNLFPDIGDEERTTGRSVLRKMFVHVDTPDTDVLKDAIGVIIAPPQDSNVHVSMFATGSYSDERAAARNRVEAYITKGVESRFTLMGDHYIGQRALSMYAMKDAATPDIGDNLCLGTTANSNLLPHEQYIRVRSILSRTTQTFVDVNGAFERDVLILESETALLHDFYGQEASRLTSAKPPTRIYETNNIDAATYYSVRRLVEGASPGDLTVNVGSPYVPIVPSTLAETPVVDQLAGLGAVSYVQSGATDSIGTTYNSSFPAGVPVTRYLGSPLVRGAVTASAGGVMLTDDGNGALVADGLSPWRGAVDYGAGTVAIAHDTGTSSQAVTIAATPAAAVIDQAYTQSIAITPVTQSYNHVLQLTPLPSPGTTVIDYRALGRWIRLTDNGKGQLVGKPGQGSGTVNYQTGSVVITLGALPDIDSQIIASWGTGVLTERRDGQTTLVTPRMQLQLEHGGVVPDAVTVTWRSGGNPVTASDDGAGNLRQGGVAVGGIIYGTGDLWLQPATLPDDNTLIVVDYRWAPVEHVSLTPTANSGGIVAFNLAGAPLKPGSVAIDWQVTLMVAGTDLPPASVILRARDDGNGVIRLIDRPEISTSIGTVNYATGAVSLKVGGHRLQGYRPEYLWINRLRLPKSIVPDASYEGAFGAATIVNVRYLLDTVADTQVSESYELPPVEIELTRGIVNPVVPGGLRMVFRGRTYVDRDGALYYGVDPMTGAGTYAGTLNYSTGRAVITAWSPGGANTVDVRALLVRSFDPGVSGLFFRTPGSPLRTASFTLRATTLDGQQIVATTDANGNLLGPLVEGKVSWPTGVVEARFGQWVPRAGNENEPWYDPSNVVADEVWQPAMMAAGTIHFGAVVFRSIPMSSVVVGLDPVRLPPDGLVPVYKPSQTVLVHHTRTHEIVAPAPDQLIDLGRGRIAQIEVRDSVGVPVDSIWWASDLDAGTVRMSDPLNLSAYTLPLVIRDRVEDRRLVAEVQITGEISLNRGLTHEFPPDETMVSTALRLGEANGSLDLQARVQGLFDIQTWNSVWASGLQPGQSGAPASYNDVDFPLVVTNADAITERWAIRFTNATSFEVIGETIGVIATGTTNTDCAPLNPRTGEPYFVLRREGWGLGWATNNALRFDTIGALAPLWMVRTTLAGSPETMIDSFRLQVVGNIQGDAA